MERQRNKGPGGRGSNGSQGLRDSKTPGGYPGVDGEDAAATHPVARNASATHPVARNAPARDKKLAREKSARDGGQNRDGGAWLYGLHPVLAALDNPHRRCRRLIGLAPELGALDPRLQKALIRRDLAYEPVTRDMIERSLPTGAVHQGLALDVMPLEDLNLGDVCERQDGERAIVLVLDQVTDPHNVGAIMRSAAAFGARAVVMTDRHAPGATAVLAKTASGALDMIPLVRVTNLARALDELGDLGYWRVALDGNAPETLAESDTSGAVALVLGAEGDGLRRLTKERCDTVARLPITGAITSLNVSNAAAIALYELIREKSLLTAPRGQPENVS